MVGNTIVESVHQNLEIAESKTHVLNHLCLDEGKFMVATSHRQEIMTTKADSQVS